jgi:hypothetical protein
MVSVSYTLPGVFEHIRPVVAGGKSTFENIVLACTACNGIAGHRFFANFESKKAYILPRRESQTCRQNYVEYRRESAIKELSRSLEKIADTFEAARIALGYEDIPAWMADKLVCIVNQSDGNMTIEEIPLLKLPVRFPDNPEIVAEMQSAPNNVWILENSEAV